MIWINKEKDWLKTENVKTPSQKIVGKCSIWIRQQHLLEPRSSWLAICPVEVK